MKGHTLNVNLGTDPRQELGSAAGPGWINPTAEAGGISQYVEAIRSGWWLVLATVLACVGANLLILSRSDKIYEATSYVVVSPVSDREGTLAGLSLFRESNDPARNLETLAKIIKTPAVAIKVKALTKVADTPRQLLSDISVTPVAQSDLLSITAKNSSPRLAQQLATAFVEATIQNRTTQLHAQVDRLIAGLKPLLRGNDPASAGVATRLAQLQALRIGPDPTVRLETPAELPHDPTSPKPVLSTVVSLIAGLLTGLGAVFGMQLIDPRVRSERQLRELYRLPILARVPKLRGPFGRTRTSAMDGAQNSYQALRVGLISIGKDLEPGRSVMLTGPSMRDGKTTTAIGLARAIAQTGQRTTLVEADVRRPSVGSAMGASSTSGLFDVVSGSTPVVDALTHPLNEPDSLKVLLVEKSGDWLPDALVAATADRLLTELEETSDWIVIDSAPLGRVIDTLPLAMLACQLLLVVRLGKSRISELTRLTDLLAQYGIRPTGFVVIGEPPQQYYG